MTRKRYFYTDPMAAAWQAKHFGMKIAIPDTKEGWTLNELIIAFQQDAPIFIHPDSESLLRVELGDVVSMTRAMDKYALVSAEELRDAFNAAGDYEIIQRDGKAFHWPECSESNGI
jgi:hypothetical protein